EATKSKNFALVMKKKLSLPVFFPDATYAAIHSLPFHEISKNLTGLVVTTLHMEVIGMTELLQKNSVSYKTTAKLPEDMTLLTDSGGFQVLSLINNHKLGKITEEGAVFRFPNAPKKKHLLTPERS